MSAETVADVGVWVAEVTDGRSDWELYTELFWNSAEAGCLQYLDNLDGATVYAKPKNGYWEVEVTRKPDDPLGIVDCLCARTFGTTMLDALACVCGLLEGIRRGSIEYTLSAEPCGAGATC